MGSVRLRVVPGQAAAVPGVHATEGTAKPPRMRSRRSPVYPFQRPLPFKPFIQSPWSAPPRIRGGFVFNCWLATRLSVFQQVAPEDGGQLTHTTHSVHPPPDELRTTVDPGKFECAGGESRQTPSPTVGAPFHRPAAIGNHTQSAVSAPIQVRAGVPPRLGRPAECRSHGEVLRLQGQPSTLQASRPRCPRFRQRRGRSRTSLPPRGRGSVRSPGLAAYQLSVARAATPWFAPPASGLSRRCASMPSSKRRLPGSSTPSP